MIQNGFNREYRKLNHDQSRVFRDGVKARLNWLPATLNHKKHGRRGMTPEELEVVQSELERAKKFNVKSKRDGI